MIQIDELRSLDSEIDQLSEYALLELARAGDVANAVLHASSKIWKFSWNDKPFAIVGVVRPSMMGTARLWFLLYRDVKLAHLRHVREGMRIVLGEFARVETAIENGYDKGRRFAKWCGFRPMEREEEILGNAYRVYEAK